MQLVKKVFDKNKNYAEIRHTKFSLKQKAIKKNEQILSTFMFVQIYCNKCIYKKMIDKMDPQKLLTFLSTQNIIYNFEVNFLFWKMHFTDSWKLYTFQKFDTSVHMFSYVYDFTLSVCVIHFLILYQIIEIVLPSFLKRIFSTLNTK